MESTENKKNNLWSHRAPATERNLWSHRAHAQPVQTPCRHCRCKKTQTSSEHEPKTAQTANQKTLSRHLRNNLKQPQSTIFGATEHMPSLCKHPVDTADAKRPKHRAQTPKEHMPGLCKHHLDTADAKRPKHHLDTSRKPPKPQAKKLFHVTFGIHINPHKTKKQSLEPQSTSHGVTVRIHIHKTNIGATEHMPSLCKHHLDTFKKIKHHLDTSRKPPKPQAKKLFHVTFGIHIKQKNKLWSHRAHAQPMQTPSGHCRCKKTQTPAGHEPKTAQTASQKTLSRHLWKPHK